MKFLQLIQRGLRAWRDERIKKDLMKKSRIEYFKKPSVIIGESPCVITYSGALTAKKVEMLKQLYKEGFFDGPQKQVS